MNKMKRIATGLMAAICVFLFVGCSSEAKDVDLNTVMDTINSDYNIQNTTAVADKDKLNTLYQIAQEDVESFAAEISDTEITEIILVKAVDADAATRISEKLQIRLNSKKSQAASYEAEVLDLVKQCEVSTNNDVYVSLIVADNVKDITATYDSFFE